MNPPLLPLGAGFLKAVRSPVRRSPVPRFAAVLLLTLAGAACSTATTYFGPGDTGLRGQVLRGPIQPVCHQGEPCDDAPFAATFHVYREERHITTFRSRDDGRFEVALNPGSYTIVPGADAPIIAPESQGQEVEVGTDGITEVTLRFDTGIR
jgi:hypothetical protein